MLEALEAAGLVSVRRDSSGLHIEQKGGMTTILQSALELLQKDWRETVATPLSNKRLKLSAPVRDGPDDAPASGVVPFCL